MLLRNSDTLEHACQLYDVHLNLSKDTVMKVLWK